jgi:hypothetical protein
MYLSLAKPSWLAARPAVGVRSWWKLAACHSPHKAHRSGTTALPISCQDHDPDQAIWNSIEPHAVNGKLQVCTCAAITGHTVGGGCRNTCQPVMKAAATHQQT